MVICECFHQKLTFLILVHFQEQVHTYSILELFHAGAEEDDVKMLTQHMDPTLQCQSPALCMPPSLPRPSLCTVQERKHEPNLHSIYVS